MSNDKKPRLLLPPGAQITAPGGAAETLTEQAFLLLSEADIIKVPDDTVLDIPVMGKKKVKASTGTEMKATSGTRTDKLVSVELTVPACTMSQPFSGGGMKQLADGTKIKTADNGEPVVVMALVSFKALASS